MLVVQPRAAQWRLELHRRRVQRGAPEVRAWHVRQVGAAQRADGAADGVGP